MTNTISVLEGDSALDFNSDVFKTFILFVDIVSSAINVFLQAAVSNTGLAIASLVVFGFFGVASIVSMVVISIILAWQKEDGKWFYISTDSVIILGATLYFVGDNLPLILASYSEQLSCGERCIEDVRTAGRCLIFAALICFRVVPLLLRKWIQMLGKTPDEITNHKVQSAAFILHMLALMLEFDAIYSVVWGDSFTPRGTCTPSDLAGSWASWSVLWLVWVAFVLIYFFLATDGVNCNLCDSECSVSLMSIALPLLCLCLGTYLLGDNGQPIGCVCNGDGNTTISATGCTELTGNQIRSGFMGGTILSFVGIVVIVVIFFARQ